MIEVAEKGLLFCVGQQVLKLALPDTADVKSKLEVFPIFHTNVLACGSDIWIEHDN